MQQEQLNIAYSNERDLVAKECGTPLDSKSIQTAVVHFYGRLDDTIKGASAHMDDEIQCSKGCSYCCYFKVDVGAHEVFAIVDHLKAIYDEHEVDALIEKAKQAKNKVSMLSQAKRVVTNIACPLLENNECSVYSIRPSMCRKIHSINVDACKKSYDNPEDMNVSNAEHPVLSAITMTMATAAREGFSARKLDDSLYDLNEVLAVALEDDHCKKRWLNGGKAFSC